MKTKFFKSSIAIIFLLLFTGAKAFGYHHLLHDHDTQGIECEVCDKALADQFSPLDNVPDQPEITPIPKDFQTLLIDFYASRVYTQEYSAILYSRPPPFLN